MSTKKIVFYFVYYKNILMTTVQTIFPRLPTTFRRLTKILLKFSECLDSRNSETLHNTREKDELGDDVIQGLAAGEGGGKLVSVDTYRKSQFSFH